MLIRRNAAMTTNRPPLPDRWEYHLATSLLAGLLLALQYRSHDTDPTEEAQVDPAVRRWLSQGRSADAAYPWRAQLSTERQALRVATGLWVAWRAFRLERGARQS